MSPRYFYIKLPKSSENRVEKEKKNYSKWNKNSCSCEKSPYRIARHKREGVSKVAQHCFWWAYSWQWAHSLSLEKGFLWWAHSTFSKYLSVFFPSPMSTVFPKLTLHHSTFLSHCALPLLLISKKFNSKFVILTKFIRACCVRNS